MHVNLQRHIQTWQVKQLCVLFHLVFFRFMLSNTTFSNISVISWLVVLMVEETGVLGENHRPVASCWQTLSQYCYKYCYSDSRKLWAVMKGGGLATVVLLLLQTSYIGLLCGNRCSNKTQSKKTTLCLVSVSFFRFMLSNTTFSNISVISWLVVLMVEETGVLGENHEP
jgi:hypothetical protein